MMEKQKHVQIINPNTIITNKININNNEEKEKIDIISCIGEEIKSNECQDLTIGFDEIKIFKSKIFNLSNPYNINNTDNTIIYSKTIN